MTCICPQSHTYIERFIEGLLTGVPVGDTDCENCRREAEQMGQVWPHIHEVIPVLEPSTRTKARVMALCMDGEVPVQPWKTWHADVLSSDLKVVPAREEVWESTQFEGVEVRRLHADPNADMVTMMVRMSPGSAYPPHVHGGAEECFVLSGELKVGSHILSSGDYQYAPQGSTHLVQATEKGCLLLIHSSFHDELLV